jgi:hypothetical protein
MSFKVIHTEYEDVLSTVYVMVVYIDLGSNSIFYHTIPIDTLNQLDFLVEDYIKKNHHNSHKLTDKDSIERFKHRDVLLSKIRQHNLDLVLK